MQTSNTFIYLFSGLPLATTKVGATIPGVDTSMEFIITFKTIKNQRQKETKLRKHERQQWNDEWQHVPTLYLNSKLKSAALDFLM